MKLRSASSLLPLLAGMAAAFPAAAQEADQTASQAPPSNSHLEEIIVTAQKRAENVQTAPLAVTAITGDTLQQNRVLAISDLAQTMTGISFTANSPQANEINIRGVVNTRLTGPTADQSVSTFVDDVYVARSGVLNTNFYDVARVEVVRGPQGVLLGKNVAGGAVNVISNAPTATNSAGMTLTLGNYDLRQTQGFINGAITDTLDGRISFQTLSHSGYAKDLLHHVDLEDADSTQGRAQLAWNPGDFRVRLIGDYSHEENGGVNRVGVASPTLPAGPTIWSGARSLIAAARGGLGPRESYPVWPLFQGDVAPTPQGQTKDNYSAVLNIEANIAPDIVLSSITGYRWNKSFTLYDQTGLGPVNGFSFTPTQLAGVGSSLLFAEPVNFRESGNFLTQEVRLTSNNPNSRFDWILGVFYLNSNVTQRNRFWGESLALATLSGESHWIDAGHNRDYAVFGQIGYDITDALKLEAGVRYTHDEKSGTQQGIIVATGDSIHPADTAPLTPLQTNFTAPYGDSWSKVTPQVTLRWTPTDTLMTYATVSTGFKGGGFQNNAPNAFAAQQAYNPETVTNYEVGLKTELFDRTLRWNSALFQMSYKDLQVQQTLASCLCNVISNAASATIRGVETDLEWAPTDNFRGWFSGTWLDATYDQFVFAGVNNSGNKLQRTPNYQIAVGGEVTMDLGSWHDALTGRLAYRYQGKMPWAPENTAWENAYGTLDGRLTLTPPDSNWRFSLWGKNMTDELYRTNIIVFFHDEMSSYAAPRTFGVEVAANF
ncbi:MAG TPA: TonB-dependent receptor [Caulobacterales bacterium]|nr:TonB-dependent receptor [Caulobacterales bacterium]